VAQEPAPARTVWQTEKHFPMLRSLLPRRSQTSNFEIACTRPLRSSRGEHGR